MRIRTGARAAEYTADPNYRPQPGDLVRPLYEPDQLAVVVALHPPHIEAVGPHHKRSRIHGIYLTEGRSGVDTYMTVHAMTEEADQLALVAKAGGWWVGTGGAE